MIRHRTLRQADRRRTALYARRIGGITAAGLEYLGKLVATGKSHQGGNEAIKLHADGLVEVIDSHYRPTRAGCEKLRQARTLGW